VSSVALTVKNDTEKEDRQAAVRATWEVGQQGRAAKAKKSRDKYVQAKIMGSPNQFSSNNILVVPSNDQESQPTTTEDNITLASQSRALVRSATTAQPRSYITSATSRLKIPDPEEYLD
jgi:hypothetical protein